MRSIRFNAALAALATLAVCAASATAQTANAARVADSLFAAHAYQPAFDAYERLIRADSSVARYWFQLGSSAASLQRYDRGVAAFEKAAAIGRNPAAFYNVGAMFARLGQSDSAFAWLTTAVNLGVGDTTLLKTDDDLTSIRGDARFSKLLYAVTHPPTPCADQPVNRRLDFWVGEWSVTTQGGTPVGESNVQIVSDGCAVLENWTSLRGGTGHSLNAYNPIEKQWQQYWVGGGGGVIEYRESKWEGPSLAYLSRTTAGSGPGTISKLTFSPLPDGSVRQHGEASKDNGTTWTTTYDFVYHRRKSP